jgi:chromosome segregation ATPase
MSEEPEEYITLDATMKRLRLSRRQVYRYAQENRIRVLPTRQGQLYRRQDVEDLAEALKVDERPTRANVDIPRTNPDRVNLTREIEELRLLRADLQNSLQELRQQRLLSDAQRDDYQAQKAQLDQAIAELEAIRKTLNRPFYQRWELWAVAILALTVLLITFLR